MSILISVTLCPVGWGHAAVLGSKSYTELLVPTLTDLTSVYTEIPAFVLLGVVASDTHEAILG